MAWALRRAYPVDIEIDTFYEDIIIDYAAENL